MEPNVPSHLDTPYHCVHSGVDDPASELKNPLVGISEGISGRDSECHPTVLKVLGVRVVDTTLLPLHITIPLHGICKVVLQRWKHRRIGDEWRKASRQISSLKDIPRRQCYLSLHTFDFITGIQGLELLKFSVEPQVRISRGNCSR